MLEHNVFCLIKKVELRKDAKIVKVYACLRWGPGSHMTTSLLSRPTKIKTCLKRAFVDIIIDSMAFSRQLWLIKWEKGGGL